ncbi:hypothetical protein Fcan01_26551 [Folsomia candida]|uniref:Uncharacterized protein n=1 Tax=Folsomia candida TaxID=158441 RepID=A0A226CZ94_FOLCA|nr:hypothetical protein Fcan01_26551 [Folsomia candida]
MHPTTYFFLAYSLIFAAQEDCSLTDEAVKVMKDAFKIFFPDKPFLTCLLYLEGSLINNLCPQGNAKHPTGCKDVEQVSKEIEDFIRSKGSKLLVGGAIGQRIKSLFGGGDLGRNVAKCINEIITITTKGGKLFVCKLGKCD